MAVYDIYGNELTTVYSIDGSQLSDAYDIEGNSLVDSEEFAWLDTAVLTALPNVNLYGGTKQGACTDGQYIYQCSGDSSQGTYMEVIKYKISDGSKTVVRYEGTPNFGHANDMTYNPNTGYIYVCTMRSDGSIIVLDADDLSYVDTVYMHDANGDPYYVWQFCYDRKANKYYSSFSGDSYIEYDSDFNYVRTVNIAQRSSATAQGCETDGTYFYRITYNPNLIDVCTLSGEFVATITVPISGEPETIMYDWNGQYYMNKNSATDMLYKLKMFVGHIEN